MQTVRDLRQAGDTALHNGEFRQALLIYATWLRMQPLDLDARLRVADSLLALGALQPAAQVYTVLAQLAAHSGYPLRALIALKVLASLEPQLGSLIQGLADLYAAGSPRLGRGARPAPPDPNTPLPAGFQLGALPDDAALLSGALAIAGSLEGVRTQYPDKLLPIPLFSLLPPGDFAAVLSALKLVRARPGSDVIREGDAGQSFYVVARGSVSVWRKDREAGQIQLAELRDGAIFGELALLSSAPRSATVSAIQDCDLLEFDRDALTAASSTVATIARALSQFTQERLVNNLVTTAPIFRPLDRAQRMSLVKRFSAYEAEVGTALIRQGAPGQGLFVVLRGEVSVARSEDGNEVQLARLGPGDVFGEIALLGNEPTTASVTATQPTTVLMLGRDYFQKLVEAVPDVREYVERIRDDRLMDQRLGMDMVGFSDLTPLADDDEIEIDIDL